MKLFVYGTLKKGGGNHRLLEGSKFVCNYELKNHILFDIGFGFPYMYKGSTMESVLGEVYEVNKKTIKVIDRLEGHPVHYKRHLINFRDEVDEMYCYLTTYNFIPPNSKTIKSGYWPTHKKKKLKVMIDDREYNDTTDKLVFHMRFFDGDRTPTNKDYMEMVKNRSKIQLNTEDEEIFIRQCIAKGIIKEIV